MLTKKELAKCIDASLLYPDVTHAQLKKLCASARKYRFHCVTINSANVAFVKKLLKGTNVCVNATIGYPTGAVSTDVKVFETRQAIAEGANEIDMVMNLGRFKQKDYGLDR